MTNSSAPRGRPHMLFRSQAMTTCRLANWLLVAQDSTRLLLFHDAEEPSALRGSGVRPGHGGADVHSGEARPYYTLGKEGSLMSVVYCRLSKPCLAPTLGE